MRKILCPLEAELKEADNDLSQTQMRIALLVLSLALALCCFFAIPAEAGCVCWWDVEVYERKTCDEPECPKYTYVPLRKSLRVPAVLLILPYTNSAAKGANTAFAMRSTAT